LRRRASENIGLLLIPPGFFWLGVAIEPTNKPRASGRSADDPACTV